MINFDHLSVFNCEVRTYLSLWQNKVSLNFLVGMRVKIH